MMVAPLGVPTEMTGAAWFLLTTGASARRKILEHPESKMAMSKDGILIVVKG